MVGPLVLNGFVVDPDLAVLMRRADWGVKRTDSAWLNRFPTDPGAQRPIPFVEFCRPDWAERENAGLRDPELAILYGSPDPQTMPGDFDPGAGYLIGFTDAVDAAICVDLRRTPDGAIIYDNHRSKDVRFATAFQSVRDFVNFYVDQHGQTGQHAST